MDTEDFDYVRPMEKAPATCQIKDEDYGAFLNTLKNTQLYDAIVFEASAGFTQEKLRLFSLVDKVVVFFTPQKASLRQLDIFLNSIRRDDEKLLLVCNRMKTPAGADEMGVWDGRYPISEYIAEQKEPFGLEEIRESGLLKKLAYILG